MTYPFKFSTRFIVMVVGVAVLVVITIVIMGLIYLVLGIKTDKSKRKEVMTFGS